MIQEALEYLVGLATDANKAEVKAPEDLVGHYTDKSFTLITEPAPKSISASTLQGLLDYLDTNRDGLHNDQIIVHVVEPRLVTVRGALNEHNVRHCYLGVAPPNQDLGFFGQPLEPEAFVVALLTRFRAGVGDQAALLQQVGNVTIGDVRTLADDGVTQEVTTKAGGIKMGTQALKNPVFLAPLRSFPEINLGVVPYVLRAQQRDGRAPLFTLHEADGGAWAVQAISMIASFLRPALEAKKIALIA